MSFAYSHGYRGVSRGRKIVHEHVDIVERVIGRRLPPGVEVHHVNGVRDDNRNTNLVVCPDRKYHQLLHVRTAALNACGNANFRRCVYCGPYDDPARMSNHGKGTYKHRECNTTYNRSRRSHD